MAVIVVGPTRCNENTDSIAGGRCIKGVICNRSWDFGNVQGLARLGLVLFPPIVTC